MKNKKGFLARHWMVAFTVCIAVIAIGYLMVQGMATRYDNPKILDVNFQNTYDKYSEIGGTVHDMLGNSTSEEGLSFKGIYEVSFGATFTVIRLIFASLLLPGAMLRQFSLDVGAPSAIANIIFTLPLIVITIVIVLVIISSISRGKI